MLCFPGLAAVQMARSADLLGAAFVGAQLALQAAWALRAPRALQALRAPLVLQALQGLGSVAVSAPSLPALAVVGGVVATATASLNPQAVMVVAAVAAMTTNRWVAGCVALLHRLQQRRRYQARGGRPAGPPLRNT